MGLDPLGAREQCFIFEQASRTAIIEWPAANDRVHLPPVHSPYVHVQRETKKINKDKIHKFICLNIESTVTLRLLPARMQKKKKQRGPHGRCKGALWTCENRHDS
jgi:hypothetical protein